MRCVPDAAMDADPASGYSIICNGAQVSFYLPLRRQTSSCRDPPSLSIILPIICTCTRSVLDRATEPCWAG